MRERQDLAIVDAQFSAPAVAVPRFTAKDALEVNAELQAFIKGLMSHPSTWPKVNGKPHPPAVEIMKLWSPLGCEAEIISRNEHGELGVRRSLIELPNGEKDVKFSVTMRIRACRLGSELTVTASQLLSEKVERGTNKPLPEYAVEAQVETRGRTRALKALAGFDPSLMSKPTQAPQEKMDGSLLISRACKLDRIPCEDKEMFLDWAREKVRGCEGMTTLTVRHAKLIIDHLDFIEDNGL